jgi:hypothetical protein
MQIFTANNKSQATSGGTVLVTPLHVMQLWSQSNLLLAISSTFDTASFLCYQIHHSDEILDTTPALFARE